MNIKTERRTAKEIINSWILANPSEVMTMSLCEISEKFTYSEAMIIKAIKELGYEGLKDLKKHLYLLEKKQKIEQNENYYEDLLLQSIMATERRIVDDEAVQEFAKLQKGKKIIFQGFGAANRMAVDFATSFELLGCQTKAVEFKEELIPHRGELLVVLTTRGSSQITKEIIEYARLLGMKIIIITGQDSSLQAKAELIIKYIYFFTGTGDQHERIVIMRYILSKIYSYLSKQV